MVVGVARDGLILGLKVSRKLNVCRFEQIYFRRIKQIDALTEPNDRADDGSIAAEFSFRPPPCLLMRMFPKIDSVSEPIVGVLTRIEWFAA